MVLTLVEFPFGYFRERSRIFPLPRLRHNENTYYISNSKSKQALLPSVICSEQFDFYIDNPRSYIYGLQCLLAFLTPGRIRLVALLIAVLIRSTYQRL